MGCVECRICRQNEEKNQFDFPFETPNKNKLTYENTDLNDIGLTTNTNFNSNQAQNPNFLQKFEEKLNSIGKYIPEEEFKNLLSEIEPNLYIPNEPFPFEIRSNSHKMKPIEFEQGNIYEGEWNENFEMDGYGKYFLREEKVLAEGIWEKGELKKARIFYPNGEFYEGEMANSIYNGKGKLINENKDIFIGEFLDGEKIGEGKINFSDGVVYTGNFFKNNFNGYGVLDLGNGLIYKGNFGNNFLEGKGTLINNEEKYEGDFEKNLFHGKGLYTYNNGDEYEGDFEFGIRKGKGIYRQKDGLIFEGFWENNVPNGFGKINYNGNVIKCNYHNGKIMDRPVDENGLYHNNIDYNFYNQKMNLSGQKIPHLANPDIMSPEFRAGTILSFLEEEKEEGDGEEQYY